MDRGLLHPITVATVNDGSLLDSMTKIRIVAGRHRLAAVKQLGWTTIPCLRINGTKLELECDMIDENLLRNDLSGPERTKLIGRRLELGRLIIDERAEHEKTEAERVAKVKEMTNKNLSQVGTGLGGRGKTERAEGSIRDFAKKTKQSPTSVAREDTRYKAIGPKNLDRIKGTSLSTGVQMDALAKLPKKDRTDLVKQAVAGVRVKATEKLADPGDRCRFLLRMGVLIRLYRCGDKSPELTALRSMTMYAEAAYRIEGRRSCVTSNRFITASTCCR